MQHSKHNTVNTDDAKIWWEWLTQPQRYDLSIKYHGMLPHTINEQGIEDIYLSEHPSPTADKEAEDTDILDDFIEAIKDEFKDQNWDYLTFIAERVRGKKKSIN